MSINSAEYNNQLEGLSDIMSVLAEVADETCSIQIDSSGFCHLRVGFKDTEILTIKDCAKRLDQIMTDYWEKI